MKNCRNCMFGERIAEAQSNTVFARPLGVYTIRCVGTGVEYSLDSLPEDCPDWLGDTRVEALERVARAAGVILSAVKWPRSECPHGIVPDRTPWYCDECWSELEDALAEAGYEEDWEANEHQ